MVKKPRKENNLNDFTILLWLSIKITPMKRASEYIPICGFHNRPGQNSIFHNAFRCFKLRAFFLIPMMLFCCSFPSSNNRIKFCGKPIKYFTFFYCSMGKRGPWKYCSWHRCVALKKQHPILIFDEGLMNFIVSSDAWFCRNFFFHVINIRVSVFWEEKFSNDWSKKAAKGEKCFEKWHKADGDKNSLVSLKKLYLIHSLLNCIFNSQFANEEMKVCSNEYKKQKQQRWVFKLSQVSIISSDKF